MGESMTFPSVFQLRLSVWIDMHWHVNGIGKPIGKQTEVNGVITAAARFAVCQ